MDYQLKVNGIYDQRTLEAVVSMGIKHLGFCFRPLSPYLMASNIFIDEILPKIPFGSFLYFEFENQLDPMIRYLSEKLASRNEAFQRVSICLVKITGNEECLFHSNQILEIKYDEENLKEATFLKKVSGLSFNQSQLEDKRKGQKFNDFFSSLDQFALRDGLEFELRVLSDGALEKKDLNLFDIGRISLEINPGLEVCYRNVNLEKLTRRLLELKGFCN